MIVVAAVVLGASCGGSTTTAGAVPSRSVNGLNVGTDHAVVATPEGLGVVAGNRHGHPALYLPDADGDYSWVQNGAVGALTPVAAWLDGAQVRVVGHQCPVHATTTTVQVERFPQECPRAPIFALSYDLGSHTWSPTRTPIPTDGAVVDVLHGMGNMAFAHVSVDPPAAHLGMIDLVSATVTVPVGDQPPDPHACQVNGTTVVVGGNSALGDSGTTMSGGKESGEVSPPQFFKLVDATLKPVAVNWQALPDTLTWVGFAGCSEDGVLLEVRGKSQGMQAVLVGSADSTLALAVDMLADPQLGSAPVRYGFDVTGSTVIATSRSIGSTTDQRTAAIALWNEKTGSWSDLQTRLPIGAQIAIGGDEAIVMITQHDGRFTFKTIS